MELNFTTKILNGEAPITQDTASRSERVFCIGSSFWINLEFNYRKKLKQFYDEKN